MLKFNIPPLVSSLLLQKIYLSFMFILGIWLFFLYNKKYSIEILKDIRPLRLLYCIIMFIMGIVVTTTVHHVYKGYLFPCNIFDLMFIGIAISFSLLFSIITNNLEDIESDKITNPERPSITNTIPHDHYRIIAWICLFLAFVYSVAVNFVSFFLILVFTGNYFLYSMPPLRLKMVPIISKFILALNSIVLLLLGSMFVAGKVTIPREIIVYLLILFTATYNFIDIKDYEGDKKAGIMTLPVILGQTKSKFVIGLSFLLLYPSAYFILKDVKVLLFSLILGILQFFFLIKKRYNEKPVIIIYTISVVLFIYYFVRLTRT